MLGPLLACTGLVLAPPATPRVGLSAPARVSHSPIMAAADGFVPDMQRRTIMNLVLLGGAGVPVLWLGGGFVYFFVPPSERGDCRESPWGKNDAAFSGV